MKLGLKLWSTNTDYYLKEAEKLYNEGCYDYIELYVVPDTLETIEKWKKLDIPFTLHAPHFMSGFNLANPNKEEFNIKTFKEIELFYKELNAKHIVIHPGMDGNIDETIRQLKIIKPQNMLIENKPFKAVPNKIKGEFCTGATIDEITKVINEIGCGFCLDIGHAICAANSLKKEPYEYLKEFNKLNPVCYHFSDNFIDAEIDNHFHFGQGNYDFKKIFDIINGENIVIETKKDSKENLNDFVEDVKWLKNLKYNSQH